MLVTYRHAVHNGSDTAFVCVRYKVGQPSPDVSIDVADVSFDRTGGAPDEDLVADVIEGVEDELPPDDSTTYTVVPGGSKRSKDKLVGQWRIQLHG